MSMKETMWRLPVVLLLGLLLAVLGGNAPLADGMSERGYPENGRIGPEPTVSEFAPVAHPKGPGPVTLRLRFAPSAGYSGDGKFEVRLATQGSIGYPGPDRDTWQITALPDQPYEKLITVTIHPDTMGALTVLFLGENWHLYEEAAFFIHRNDSVEFWKGYPEPLPAPSNRIPHYELTPEVLSEEHIVRLMIDSDEQEAMARRILGALPDTTDLRRSKLRLTYKMTLELLQEGIQAYFYTPTAVEQKAQQSDTGWLRESSPEDSSLEDQSCAPSDRSPAGISLALAVPQNQYGEIMLDDNVYLYLNDGLPALRIGCPTFQVDSTARRLCRALCDADPDPSDRGTLRSFWDGGLQLQEDAALSTDGDNGTKSTN